MTTASEEYEKFTKPLVETVAKLTDEQRAEIDKTLGIRRCARCDEKLHVNDDVICGYHHLED